jgi:prepilin-type processing-associated H-X9-DG protein
MREPLLVMNVGWMTKYQGLEDDKITDGGEFVGKQGFGGEIFNFLPFEGFMYGYVQPPGKKENHFNSRIIHIERLVKSANSYFVDGVLVTWAAKRPGGGTYLVGWYQNATVFRKWQPPPKGSKREFGGESLGYYVKSREEDCILLAPVERTLKVPRASDPVNGGIGQANVWFADGGKPNDIKFRKDLKIFVQNNKLK